MRKENNHMIDKLLGRLSRLLNYIGMGAVVIIMLLTVADVLMRSLFNKPITGTEELTEYLMVAVVYLGLALCARKNQNASVDLLMERFTPSVQSVFESVTGFLNLIIFGLITWQGVNECRYLWETKKVSDMLEIPSYPFYFLMAFGSLVLCAVIAVQIVQHINKSVKNES